MKYLKRLLLLLTISAAVFSCQKEYSVENPTGNSNTTAQWEFKEAGVQFKGPIDSASVDTLGGYRFLTMNGRSTDGTAQITLQLFGVDLKVGTYKTPFSLFAYIKGGTPIYQTDQTAADSFTIIISKVDSFSVAGTFTGNALSGGAVKKIVDGKFTAVIKSNVVAPPVVPDSGNVVLWSKAGCGGGTSTAAINVAVAGKAGQITSFSATEPGTCDPAGTYHLKLPVGNYPWVAKCGTDSVTGTLVVTKNGCTKQLVDFAGPVLTGDYFPTTKNSNWMSLYDPLVAQSDSTNTFVTGDTKTYGGKPYNVFIYSDYKFLYYDSLFYRKDNNGSYFEYYSDSVNIFGFDTAKAVEYTFLKDNVGVGATWSTGDINGTITDANGKHPVVARIDGSLLDKVTSVTVGGKAYNDVIKVRLSYMLGVGTAVEAFRIEEWFARGVGLVKYQEFLGPDFTSPSTIQNTVRYQVF